MSFSAPDDDPFDAPTAAALVGTYLLVGLTYVTQSDEVIEQKQVHGRILRVSRTEGIVLARHPSGDEFVLPPALDALDPAAPGEYRLRSTGEVVRDPDYTASFTVTVPANH